MGQSLSAVWLGAAVLAGSWGAWLSAEEPVPAQKAYATSPPVRRPSPPNRIERIPGDLPKTVIDRFKVPITAKFTLPLEPAFQELFAAVDVKCVVDGIALKSVGITKNEPQRLNLENKPLFEVIQAILQRADRLQTYPEVVLCIDEEKKTVTVTTRESAKMQNLKAVDFEKLRKEN